MIIYIGHIKNILDKYAFKLILLLAIKNIYNKVNIIADPSIEEGGCIFQTNNGIVDASIDTQLEIIKKAIEGI